MLLPKDGLIFPPVELAGPDGLLAVGGDLTADRLLVAYRLGIFPWYDTPPVLWWYPDPRFVLFPDHLHVSKTMKSLMKKRPFTLTCNQAFRAVINQCSLVARKGQQGTWINEEMIRAYMELHHQGYAVSVEAWQDGTLAGGLYGIRLGRMFFGESMFAKVTNASKAAFIYYIDLLKKEGAGLVDCQVHTEHLASLGAGYIPGARFKQLLRELL